MKRKPLPLHKLAKRIKKLVKRSPHTLTKVMNYAGIPPQYISKWKKDASDSRRGPYYNEIIKVAEILEKPVEYFLFDDYDQPESFVMIPREKYEAMIKQLQEHLSNISEEVSKTEETDIFDFEKYLS